MRILISSLAFLPLLILKWNKLAWKKWKYLLVVSFFGSAFPAFLFPLAQQEIASAVVGIINSLTPIFTLLIGVLFFTQKAGGRELIGVLIGFAGVSVLFLSGSGGEGEPLQFLPVFYAALAAAMYALSNNTIKSHLGDIPPLLLSTVAFNLASPFALVVLFQTDMSVVEPNLKQFWWSLAAVTVLSLFGTFLASIIFFHLVQRTTAVYGSMVAYTIPIVALMWGILDGERISVFHILGLIFIIGGVVMVRRKGKKD
jgi:drug/metabolite transporter (DMT)-like permease